MKPQNIQAIKQVGGLIVLGQVVAGILVGVFLSFFVGEGPLVSYTVGSLAVVLPGLLFWLAVLGLGGVADQRLFVLVFYGLQMVKLFVPLVFLYIIQVYVYKLAWGYVMMGVALSVVTFWLFSVKFSR
ncbi:MAG: hypothetical protein QM520_02005 [Gammaproteobacteria bacterium]|nr:hypothetical protein [Gammaproteobacteria bacterium]